MLNLLFKYFIFFNNSLSNFFVYLVLLIKGLFNIFVDNKDKYFCWNCLGVLKDNFFVFLFLCKNKFLF